jgi:VCBS repeat-containing protein
MNMSEENSNTVNDETITGSEAADTIVFTSDNTTVEAGDGANTITGTSGNNHITAGIGADTITVTTGDNTIDAGSGINTITAMSGNNQITAGDGADTITLTSGNNKINAGGGINTIAATTGNNSITTGDGADTITVSTGDNTINAGGGANTITASSGNNTITAGDGADTITTSGLAGGANTIDAGNGANTVTTGAGNDTVTSGNGADTITTGAGDDTIAVKGGIDTIAAGAGNDTLIADFSLASGAVSINTLAGTAAAGYAGNISGLGIATFAGVENFKITSGTFNDTITTGDGNDVVHAGAGNDTVNLAGGNDEAIYTMAANYGAYDIYQGGTGDDTLTLEFTKEEWNDDDVQSEIANYQEHLSSGSSASFHFGSSLTVSEFESLNVIVDGVALDLNSTTVNDVADLNEDDNATQFASVLDNDDAAALAYSVTLVSGTSEGDLTFNAGTDGAPDGSYSFNPSDDFEDLAEGETREVSFVYEVQDAYRGATQATVTVTVTGTNDAPLVQVVDFTASLHELIEKSAGENMSELSETGVFTFTDVDLTDTHTVSVEAGGADYVGSASAEVTTAATGGQTGEVTSVFTVNNADIDYLHDGETLTQTYTAHLLDSNGGRTSTQTATVTITGTNDAPLITSDANAASGAVIEAGIDDTGAIVDGTPSATGRLTSLDVDTGASATWSGDAAGTYGSFAIDPTTGAWTYTLDNTNTATDTLADGQVETEVFTVMVTDDFHATDTQDVTITVAGTNDSPPQQLIWPEHAGAYEGNTASADGGDGDDTISFGIYAGYNNGFASADGGAGNDTITFASSVAHTGSVVADGGGGNDIINFGIQAGQKGSVIAQGGAGDDEIIFANNSGSQGYLSVDGGTGNDTIEFINSTAAFGIAIVMGGEGDDNISMGSHSAVWGGIASINGGAGNDKISLGDYVGHSIQGHELTNPLATAFVGDGVIVDGGAGNDEITFGDKAGYSNGSVTADGGSGDDTIRFGTDAGSRGGSASADGGAGNDTFIFGGGAENLTIDLGEGDQDQDSVTFEGSVKNTTIDNWEVGRDVVSVQGSWTGRDDGTDTTFTNGSQEITFLEVTGIGTDVNTFIT